MKTTEKMETKHTPIPWKLGKISNGYQEIDGPGWSDFAKVVVKMKYPDSDFENMGIANAKLIVAAPEQQEASILLYELCKELASRLDYDTFSDLRNQWNKAMNAHEKAIKKATE